jgi:hypothetical protein
MSTAQWANLADDAGALPALLQRITEHAAADSIDHVWIFPARRIAAGESVVVVLALFHEDAARRRVSTAQFTVIRNRKGAATVSVAYTEHAAAPVEAVPRIVHGVLRRLGEDLEAAPHEEVVGGDAAAWDRLILEHGGRLPAPDDRAGTGDHAPAVSGDTAGTHPLLDAAADAATGPARGSAPSP